MKNILLFFSIILFILSCKKESTSTCENGHFDEGEIGIDCGGSCPDCIFNKTNLYDKTWLDVYVDNDLSTTFIREHFYRLSDTLFFANWLNPTEGTEPVGLATKSWEWLGDSDTIHFEYNNTIAPKRLILHIGEDFYKFKTDQDGWQNIHSAIIEN